MNNISDKNIIIVILATVFIVFAFVFSVKSPERKVIDSPIMWKEDFSSISIYKIKKKTKITVPKRTNITFLSEILFIRIN